MKIRYRKVTKEKINKLMYYHGFPIIGYGDNSFKGFKYFGCLEMDGIYYLAYLDELKAENIVGVLCIGEYGYENKYIGIDYIDIKKNFQHLGIGTKLFKMLNKTNFDGKKMSCSYFSEECINKNFDKVIKKTLSKQQVYYHEP